MLRRQKRRKKSRNGTKGAAQGPFVSLKVAVKSAVLRMKDEGRDTGNSFEKMVVTAANDAYMDDMIELPQSLRVTPSDLDENKMRIWLTHSSKARGRKLTAVSSMADLGAHKGKTGEPVELLVTYGEGVEGDQPTSVKSKKKTAPSSTSASSTGPNPECEVSVISVVLGIYAGSSRSTKKTKTAEGEICDVKRKTDGSLLPKHSEMTVDMMNMAVTKYMSDRGLSRMGRPTEVYLLGKKVTDLKILDDDGQLQRAFRYDPSEEANIVRIAVYSKSLSDDDSGASRIPGAVRDKLKVLWSAKGYDWEKERQVFEWHLWWLCKDANRRQRSIDFAETPEKDYDWPTAWPASFPNGPTPSLSSRPSSSSLSSSSSSSFVYASPAATNQTNNTETPDPPQQHSGAATSQPPASAALCSGEAEAVKWARNQLFAAMSVSSEEPIMVAWKALGGAQPDESMVEMAVALKAEHDEGQGPSVPDQAKVVKLMTQLAALSSD